MMKASLITAKQCRRARALLKWNPQDLASHTRIPLKHLERFERNQVKLVKPENMEVIKVFAKRGVVFYSNGEVGFENGSDSFVSDSHASFERINVDAELGEKLVALPLTKEESDALAAAKKKQTETKIVRNILLPTE